MTNEREEIFQSLTRVERMILARYEKDYGRVPNGAIYKVIEDQKELTRSNKKSNKRRK